MYGRKTEARENVGNAVVGTGGFGFGGDADGDPEAYIGFTHSLLPQNNGNLPLSFIGGDYPIVLLDNIY